MVRRFRLSVGALGLLFAVFACPSTALAQGKPKAKPAKVTKAPAKPKKAAKPKPEAEPAAVEEVAPEAAAKASSESDPKPRSGGTPQPSEAPPDKASVKEKEGPEGVKTYQFGAIEVEGRQKSPQLIYFLRRVRAEFDAGALGHRSFLGELKDTRNDTAFR